MVALVQNNIDIYCVTRRKENEIKLNNIFLDRGNLIKFKNEQKPMITLRIHSAY